jgi:proteic killer suppression protein
MIESFGDRETEKVWNGEFSKKLPQDIQQRARRKLNMLNSSSKPEDLRIPPNNHLEHLSGNWESFYSIRINQQWRVCFRFEGGNATDVQIVDYH